MGARGWLLLGLIVLPVALLWHGMAWAKFLPTREAVEVAELLRYPLLILIVAAFALRMRAVRRDPALGRAATSGGNRILMAVGGLLLAWGIHVFGGEALARSVGAIHAQVATGTPASVEGTVTKRGDRYNRNGCDREGRIAPDGWEGRSIGVCDLPSPVFGTMEEGSRLRLTGTATRFGLRYTGAQLLDE